MLLKKLVKKTLGIKDQCVEKIIEDGDEIHIYLEHISSHHATCSCCGRRMKVRDRLQMRRWRHVPLWNIPVFIYYRPVRVKCSQCGIKVESIPWSHGKSCLSKPLSHTMSVWSRQLPMDVVSRIFGVSWNAVYSGVKQVVAYGLANRKESGARILGIDEISRKKGHKYLTQIYDLIDRKLLSNFEDRTYEGLKTYFESLGDANLRKIKIVCCDMWDPYIKAIKEKLPDAAIVFDKFHIVRHLLDAVNEVRKQEAASLKKTNPELLKGTRYIWLKNPWNLTDKQKQRFSHLEKMNLKINRAYLLKENFRELWTYANRAQAKKFLDQWFWWATHSRMEPMRKFAWMVREHEEGILSYCEHPYTNAVAEAMNNNAKAISHSARGYRSTNTLSILLMHRLGKLDMPKMMHRFA
jgi:transposase